MAITLPLSVALPTRPTIRPGEAYEALGISRQSAAQWRARHGIPGAGDDGMIDTAALAGWRASRGVLPLWL